MNDTTMMITGASSGVGAAVARALGRTGAAVAACTRDGDALQLVVNDIERDGSGTSAVRADVRDELDMECLMETMAHTGGRIGVLVASAAVAHGMLGKTPASEDSYAAFDDALRTNVCGVFTAVREALPHMADDGHILVPSDSTVRKAKPEVDVYAVSKAAAEALVRQFAAGCDRTVTVVDSSLIATDLTDGQSRDPDDMANLFAWATTDADPAESDDDIADLRAWKRATH